MDLIIAALAVAAGQLVKAVTGFGSALVSIPLLAMVYGPRDAIFILVVTDLVGGVVLAWEVRHQLRWLLVGVVYALVVPGQWIGTDLLTTLPETHVALAMAAVIAVFGGDIVLNPVRQGHGELTELPAEPARILVLGGLAGFVSGVMGGLVGAGGPPLILYMRRFFADAFFRANLIAIFLLGSITLIAMLVFKDAVSDSSVWIAAVLVIPMMVGNRAGARLAGRLNRVTFGRIVGVILLVAAAGLALPAAKTLLAG